MYFLISNSLTKQLSELENAYQMWSNYNEERNALEELLLSEFDMDLMMANMRREDPTQYLNVGHYSTLFDNHLFVVMFLLMYIIGSLNFSLS
jgi:hypothetical protein